jgi:hypothetical protein
MVLFLLKRDVVFTEDLAPTRVEPLLVPLPGNSHAAAVGAVAVMAIIPALAIYGVLEWQFAQAEITGPMPRAHLSAGGRR